MLKNVHKTIAKRILYIWFLVTLFQTNYALSAAYKSLGVSASEIANASAGRAAYPNNLSNIRINPALALSLKQPRFSISTVYALNSTDISDGSQTQALDADDISDNTIQPSLFIAFPLNKHWALGFAMFSDYHFNTEYPSDYPAGLNAGERRLFTYEFNPHLAVQLTDKLTFGLGASLIYAEKEITTFYGNENTPSPSQQYLNYDATGTDYRANIGLLYDINKYHSFGLAYKSGTEIETSGTLNKYSRNNLLTFNGDATNQIIIPSEIEFSGKHQLDRRFSLLYSLTWVSWGDLSKDEIVNSQCTPDPVLGLTQGQCFSESVDAKDNIRLAIATNYNINDAMILHSGLSMENSSGNTSFSYPIEQHWLSVGLTMAVNRKLSINIGAAYGFSKDTNIHDEINNVRYDVENKASSFTLATQINYQFLN